MDKLTIIKPPKGIIGINFRELYEYRELAWVLSVKEIKIRYKQTLVGGSWAIINPLLMMVVFTIFFGNMLNVPSDGVPYPIFSYSGLLLWTYFTTSLVLASNSLVANSQMVSKVYFPRLLLPISATLVGILDYSIASLILVGLMYYYQIFPTFEILLIPIIVFVTWMLATGLGFWLSAIMVKYRDVKFIVPFFTSLLIYLTPVIYPVSVASEFRWLLALNPMTGLIEAHRGLILGSSNLDFNLLLISFLITIFIFVSGAIYFKRVERAFADII